MGYWGWGGEGSWARGELCVALDCSRAPGPGVGWEQMEEVEAVSAGGREEQGDLAVVLGSCGFELCS